MSKCVLTSSISTVFSPMVSEEDVLKTFVIETSLNRR